MHACSPTVEFQIFTLHATAHDASPNRNHIKSNKIQSNQIKSNQMDLIFVTCNTCGVRTLVPHNSNHTALQTQTAERPVFSQPCDWSDVMWSNHRTLRTYTFERPSVEVDRGARAAFTRICTMRVSRHTLHLRANALDDFVHGAACVRHLLGGIFRNSDVVSDRIWHVDADCRECVFMWTLIRSQ